MLEPERLVGNIHKLQFPLRPIGYAARRFFLIPPKDQQAGFTQDIGRMLEKAAQPLLSVHRNGIEAPVGMPRKAWSAAFPVRAKITETYSSERALSTSWEEQKET